MGDIVKSTHKKIYYRFNYSSSIWKPTILWNGDTKRWSSPSYWIYILKWYCCEAQSSIIGGISWTIEPNAWGIFLSHCHNQQRQYQI